MTGEEKGQEPGAGGLSGWHQEDFRPRLAVAREGRLQETVDRPENRRCRTYGSKQDFRRRGGRSEDGSLECRSLSPYTAVPKGGDVLAFEFGDGAGGAKDTIIVAEAKVADGTRRTVYASSLTSGNSLVPKTES